MYTNLYKAAVGQVFRLTTAVPFVREVTWPGG